VYKNNLGKHDLTKNLSLKTGLSSNISKKLINDLINSLIEIIKIENLNLKNIGSFKKRFKKERIGRNPKTKEEFKISPRYIISFSPSKNLVNFINKYL
tara:strand:- start:38 stop:331 length:294 start_codon:yes stop_codon:yes gene_type:complete